MARSTRRPRADRSKVSRAGFDGLRAALVALKAEVALLRRESEIQIRRAGEIQQAIDALKKLIART